MLLISLSLHTSMLRVESLKVVEGHRRSFPDTRLTFQVKKVMGGGGWPVGLASAPVPVSLLWTLDFRFETLDFNCLLCFLLYVSAGTVQVSPRGPVLGWFLLNRSAQRSTVTRRISTWKHVVCPRPAYK